jgi:CheY-like chemotaxis protein
VPYHPKDRKLMPGPEVSKFILIGEDDLDDEELLKELFFSVDESFTLTFINNGRRVVEYLQSVPDQELPCLIILDYNMPELDGAHILEELKNDNRYLGVPKIIWSTSQSETYRKKCLELGADDYIIKPSKVSELIDAIKYVISFC